MIIRSQDKKSTTTDLNLEIYINEKKNEYVIGNVMCGRYGTYSTEEKAIKVLDMVCEEYKKYTSAKSMSTYFAFIPPKVFQMPQDSEV